MVWIATDPAEVGRLSEIGLGRWSNLMNKSSILQGKIAVVFGAGGSIGTAVASEFAAQGADVFLAGRTQSNLEKLAAEIAASGGTAHAAVVDAADDAAVGVYIDGIVKQAGRVDIAFNAVGPRASDYGNDTHAVDLPIEQFMVPLTTIVKPQFITARAAARQMVKQKMGVILFLTGSPARGHVEGATAIGTAFGAIETLAENLAVEVSQHGVRSVCLRTTANIDSRAIQQTMDIMARKTGAAKDQLIARFASLNFLKTPARVSDTAKAAVFLVSDYARLMTGTVVNSTAGAALD
jgi:3-oxoacyl-[acyl-carrier protein] reductase